jgi:hypothetical protein
MGSNKRRTRGTPYATRPANADHDLHGPLPTTGRLTSGPGPTTGPADTLGPAPLSVLVSPAGGGASGKMTIPEGVMMYPGAGWAV